MRLVGFVLCFACLHLHASTDDCSLSEPWLTEEGAKTLLMSPKNTEYLRANVTSNSSSLELQLLLWAYIEGKVSAEDIASVLPTEDVIDRQQDALMSLLWIIQKGGLNDNDVFDIERHLPEVNSWAKGLLDRNRRRVFLNRIAVSGILGRPQVGILELEHFEFMVPDADVLRAMSSIHWQNGRLEEAHELLIAAVEANGMSVLGSLSEMQAKIDPGCKDRASSYLQIYVNLF